MTVFILKIIGIITMTLDHLSLVLGVDGWNLIPVNLGIYMRYAGRLAFPIFAFLIANGWKYSKNRANYFSNLLLFAIISQIPFTLSSQANRLPINVNATQYYITSICSVRTLIYAIATILILLLYWHFILKKKFNISILWVGIASFLPALLLKVNDVWLLTNSLNVLYTMALGVFAIYCYEVLFLKREHKEWERIILLVSFLMILVLYGVNSDYDIKGVALILFLYLLREWRLAQVTLILIWASSVYILPVVTLVGIKQFLATSVAALIIYFYNNKKGPALKYLFYIYYPAHLLLIGILNIIIRSNVLRY